MSVLIAPSLLSADFGRLAEEIARVERGGADLLHVDVMDGRFVPTITIGPVVVRAIRKVATVALDVHLMIEEPDRAVEAYVDAGAARISVHLEALRHPHRAVQAIKALGVKAGIAINPATPVSALEYIAADLDHVLVMSVDPGYGGQTFLPHSESKLRAVRRLLDSVGSTAQVEVDGGVDHTNAARIVAAGADILVAGHAIFGAPDAERATRELRSAAAGAVAR